MLKNLAVLTVAGSLDMFALRWFATFDTPERWASLPALQVYAYAHGDSMCVYDPLPFLHYPRLHAFFVAPVSTHSKLVLFIAGWGVWVLAQRIGRRVGKQQVAQVEGEETNGRVRSEPFGASLTE